MAISMTFEGFEDTDTALDFLARIGDMAKATLRGAVEPGKPVPAPSPAPQQVEDTGTVEEAEKPAPKKRGRPKKAEKAEPEQPAPKKRGRPRKTEKQAPSLEAEGAVAGDMKDAIDAKEKAEAEAQPEQMPSSDQVTPEVPEITEADLRALCSTHARYYDKDKTVERLKEMNVTKLSALDPSRYAELHAKLTADIESKEKQAEAAGL